MRYKKLVATTAIAGSFFLGVIFSEPIKDIRKNFHYEAAKGFYERPYNLKIETRKNVEGKIETYLVDKETKQYKKINSKMLDNPKSKLDKALDLIEKAYDFFFTD